MEHIMKVVLFFVIATGMYCDIRKCLTLPGMNMVLLNSVFLVQHNTTLLQCAKLCWQTKICASISFLKTDFKCQLNYLTEKNSTGDYVGHKNAIYISAKDFLQFGFLEKDRYHCLLSQRYFVTKGNQYVCFPLKIKTKNAALGKNTTQSSVNGSYDGGKAVDWIWSLQDNNCFHTNFGVDHWWSVDLGSRFVITEVITLTKGGPSSDVAILYGLDLDKLDYFGWVTKSGNITTKNVFLTIGQFVTIVERRMKTMSLCEVAVIVVASLSDTK